MRRFGITIALLTICVLAVMFVGRQRHNTLPISQFKTEFGNEFSDNNREPQIVVLESKPTEHGLELSCLFVNPGNVPIYYFGDQLISGRPSGEISPVWGVEKTTDSNPDWHSERIGLCGTGLGTMTVPSKYAGRFRVIVRSPFVAAKVGVRYSTSISDVQRKTVIASSRIFHSEVEVAPTSPVLIPNPAGE